MLRVHLVRMPDHAKQGVRLGHTIDGELGVENLVAAVLAVGLGEHHQLNVGGVAVELCKRLHQIVDLIICQGQAKPGVGCLQRRLAAAQHVHMRHRGRLKFGEQLQRMHPLKHHAFGHAVVQQSGGLIQLQRAECHFAQQRLFERQAVFHNALHPAHGQATVVCNIRGFGGPRRHRAKTRRHHDQNGAADIARNSAQSTIGLAVREQRGKLIFERISRCMVRRHQMDKTR